MTLMEKAVLAEKTARAAGEMLERHGALKVTRKGLNDFATQMDLESERFIRNALLSACPEDRFFGEETGGDIVAAGRWIVDPIDGTINFMRGHLLYTVSIAYEQDGVLEVGCVYCPPTHELFMGVRGQGATLNGMPIHVADTPLSDAIVHLGFGHRMPENRERTLRAFPELLRHVGDVRRFGTAAYELSCLACGRCDAFLELGIHLYDFAAGHVILTEAGGRFTGWEDGDDGLESGNILATNGVIHEQVREILGPTTSPRSSLPGSIFR